MVLETSINRMDCGENRKIINNKLCFRFISQLCSGTYAKNVAQEAAQVVYLLNRVAEATCTAATGGLFKRSHHSVQSG